MKIENILTALPEQEVTIDVLIEKYAKGDERTPHEIRERVARALASVEKVEEQERWAREFLWAMENGFIPAGRINSAAGTELKATLINCFVQPIGDAVWGYADDGTPGIYAALQEAAETMRRGGGVGYDFSAIRPRGALVKGTHSRASGPVSYMRVFDKSCETLESAGSRRGAQMGVLRVDHPDIEEFVHAKRDGSLSNFNMSVAVTDEFMRAVEADAEFELVHEVQPFDAAAAGAVPRADGRWVYRSIRARELWDQVMRSTYNHAEPGVIFIDKVNSDNNLGYIETIAASNPCGEQFLPPYGCCDLGSLNLTRFIADPFGERPSFDFERFRKVTAVSIRALDNVLDLTLWPLPQQDREAKQKRRVGLGFTGLGNALTMLELRYDAPEARAFAAKVAETMRDAAYETSVELARERGAFPLFDADGYLAEPHAASRLPARLKAEIRKHGIRNSHLMSIAPTGTISIAFAGNASGGIEPAFSWSYTRKKRMPDGSKREYEVEDFAYRLYRHMGGNPAALPEYFTSAMQISALDHMRMSAAVQPFVDSAISKTVNVAEDYPYEEFKALYLEAWKAGLKGITTYRPNAVIGSVLSVGSTVAPDIPQEFAEDANRRLTLDKVPQPALSSLRWPGRPKLPAGNLAWSYMVESTDGRASFCIFIGQTDEPITRRDGSIATRSVAFETWVNGNEQPRGLGAIAKALSMDMRSNDRAWLKLKLDVLARTRDEKPLQLVLPPGGELAFKPGVVAAFAEIVRFRCEELGLFDALEEQPTPMIDAMMFRSEPKSGPLGTLSWTADIANAATEDDFVLGVKELQLPDGSRRPYSIWLAGDYPRVLDGLCKLLSLDMRVIDVNWIGLKLRKLLSFGELNGAFWAQVPGEQRQQVWPSTVAYVAALILHRYKVLGLLDSEGRAIGGAGALAIPEASPTGQPQQTIIAGMACPSCGAHAYIKKDGCMFCTACGHQGECG